MLQRIKKLQEKLLTFQEYTSSAAPEMQILVADILKEFSALSSSCSYAEDERLRFVEMLDSFPNPLFDEDFSAAEVIIDRLYREEVGDMQAYLHQHREIVKEITCSITIRGVNYAACDLYGLPHGQEFYRTLDALVVEASYDDFIKQILAITGGDDFFEQKMQNQNEKGGIGFLILTMAVINRKKYGLSRVLVTITDISELKAAYHQKKLLEEKLARAKRLESLGMLAGGVAHDLNNVLVGVVSYPDMLLLDMDADDPLRESLELIKNSGLEASYIVQDLLTLSRRSASAKEVLDVRRIIIALLESPEIDRIKEMHPSVQLVQDLQHGLFSIQGSRVHIRKAIMNLLMNAYEAHKDQGIVTISAKNSYRDTPYPGGDQQCVGDLIELKISDTGIGLSDADIDHIYEPFYTKKAMGQSGTGLGMTIVWGTVKDHHGNISVKSEINKGTTFTIQLPATREVLEEKESNEEVEELKGAGEHILIVDDMDTQRMVAVRILQKLGYEVESASSGNSAIELIRSGYIPDILILDMIMPGLDGLDTYKAIQKLVPHIKTIIISGYAESARVKEAISLGVTSFFQKPYTIGKLGMTIRKLLK